MRTAETKKRPRTVDLCWWRETRKESSSVTSHRSQMSKDNLNLMETALLFIYIPLPSPFLSERVLKGKGLGRTLDEDGDISYRNC